MCAATSSHYISAPDGVRLALDVHLPAGRAADQRHPTLLVLTRYLRSTINPETGERNVAVDELDKYFLDNGYAIVKIDVRGTGASFGSRAVEYGPEEVRDAHAVVDWVVAQHWCDGRVGAYGTSYTGTTAELLAVTSHPAVKAVIPGWSDFDSYTGVFRPYGLLPRPFVATWSQLVGWKDRADPRAGAVANPVMEDSDGTLLRQAGRDHERNADVLRTFATNEYRDDLFADGTPFAQLGTLHYKTEIERSGVPMLVIVSWLDAGTADGALQRFQHFANSQKVLITAGDHGGTAHASPYAVNSVPLEHQPSLAKLREMRLKFFDHYLRGAVNEVERWPALRFFNLGEEAFHDTDVWPPAGTKHITLRCSRGGDLSFNKEVLAGNDRYTVDRGVSTGEHNRWLGQMGRPILNLDDRGAMDARMLCYTTKPLDKALQIAGYPILTLQMSSDREDGTVLAYLEDVDPDGHSRYITEGGLRLIHRKIARCPYFDAGMPYHSYTRNDAAPMPVGRAVEVQFYLWPIAALIRPGHRLRLALAGADASIFDPVPPDGEVNLAVTCGAEAGSQLILPVVEGGLDSKSSATFQVAVSDEEAAQRASEALSVERRTSKPEPDSR